MVELKGYRINSISFENKVQNGTQLQLNNQIKYNVNYVDNSDRCMGMLDFAVSDANMQPFEIRIQMVAEFTYGKDDEKPDIHVISFDQLFPFVRQIISNITLMSGMPGLMIPMVKLNRDSVQYGGNKGTNDDNDSGKNSDEELLN